MRALRGACHSIIKKRMQYADFNEEDGSLFARRNYRRNAEETTRCGALNKAKVLACCEARRIAASPARAKAE
jgi:hypothetical protein